MTETSTTSLIPDSCTLPTAERPNRTAEFDDLYRGSVQGIRRIHATSLELDLVPEPVVASQAAELAARENACCSFFTFTLAISAGAIVLRVETPETHADVLAAVADRAQSLVGRPAGRPT